MKPVTPSVDVVEMATKVRARHLAWLRRRGLRESTIEQRRRCLARLSRHADRPLLDLEERDLERFLDRLTGTDGLAAEIYHVKGFYDWAVEYELIDENPAARLRRPRIPRRLPRPIATDDLALALAQATGRVRPILYLAAYAALRAKDMCGLRAEDILWHERVLVVTEGKGGHEGVVDMNDTLTWALRTSDLPSSGWLFPYADGRPGHLPAYRISQAGNQFLHSLGIESTLHQLRHWSLTEFYRATLDIRATQQFARHQSITSTTIYTLVDRSVTADGASRLPDLSKLA